MKRHFALGLLTASALAGAWLSAMSPADPSAPRAPRATYDVVEKTIPELAAAIRTGEVTSQELVRAYLA